MGVHAEWEAAPSAERDRKDSILLQLDSRQVGHAMYNDAAGAQRVLRAPPPGRARRASTVELGARRQRPKPRSVRAQAHGSQWLPREALTSPSGDVGGVAAGDGPRARV